MIPRSPTQMPSQDLLTIVRKSNTTVHAFKKEACDDTVLYENVPGRVCELRFFSENSDSSKGFGQHSAKVRRIILNGTSIPSKIQNGDYVMINWGTPPNIVDAPDVPAGTGPQVWITTPGGDVLLTWDDTQDRWENDDETVHITPGEANYSLDDNGTVSTFDSFYSCGTWPEGYAFIRFTGPPLYYRIDRYHHQRDIHGNWHHTTLQVDLADRDDPNRRL